MSVLDPRSMPPPSSALSSAELARQRIAAELALVLGRNQPRKDGHAAGLDDEVVIAAAKALAAIFDHPQPPPLGAIIGRQLLEPDHAVRDAVHGLVVRVAGEVVEHQHGRAVAREIMLQRQHLAAIAQRALREQPDFRQAVDHDPPRLDLLDRLEDPLGRLAELEVGGIKQALLLLLVEQAFGRDQLENVERIVEAPAVRGGALAQLLLGFRQSDVEAALARLSRRRSRNWVAIVVLPVPGLPSIR